MRAEVRQRMTQDFSIANCQMPNAIEEFNFKVLSILQYLINPHNDHTKRLIDQKTFLKHILQVKIKRETCKIVQLRKLWKSSLLPDHCHGKN